jgi:hypothetical protein
MMANASLSVCVEMNPRGRKKSQKIPRAEKEEKEPLSHPALSSLSVK